LECFEFGVNMSNVIQSFDKLVVEPYWHLIFLRQAQENMVSQKTLQLETYKRSQMQESTSPLKLI